MNINQQSNNTALESFSKKSVTTTKQSKNEFYDLGIASSLIKAINRLKFEKPTPIQKEAIPVGINGDDVIALAQTGSGKTFAFGIPMLQRLSKSKNGTGLVLVPTRELAIQVDEALQTLSRPLNIRTAVLIGGASMSLQRNVLRKNPRVVIATPGRLMDHLERKTLSLKKVEVFVLDEADRMLDMGFVPDIKKIMKSIPDSRQTMLFSATMPKQIEAIAKQLMDNPIRIETDASGVTPAEVSQEIFLIKNQDKGRLLAHHFKQCTGPVLVFTRTKRMATKLTDKVHNMGFTAAEIHSDRSQGQRRNALEGFKRGRYQILVATDIAARGIDVKGIELVVNYDMPANSEDYVHRIGRTGRAGETGHAISFATNAQKGSIRDIERFLKTKLTIGKLPSEMPTEKNLFIEGAKFEISRDDKRTERPRRPKSASDRMSKKRDYKKNDSDRIVRRRSDSKSFGFKKESSGEEKSFKRKSSGDDRPFKRSSSSERYSKKPSNSKSFGFKKESTGEERSFKRKSSGDDKPFKKSSSSERFSKKRDFKKNDSDRFKKRRNDSSVNSFKRKDSDKKNSSAKVSTFQNIETVDFLKNDSKSEKPFWVNLKKKRPSKKKSVGQGSGRKKSSKRK